MQKSKSLWTIGRWLTKNLTKRGWTCIPREPCWTLFSVYNYRCTLLHGWFSVHIYPCVIFGAHFSMGNFRWPISPCVIFVPHFSMGDFRWPFSPCFIFRWPISLWVIFGDLFLNVLFSVTYISMVDFLNISACVIFCDLYLHGWFSVIHFCMCYFRCTFSKGDFRWPISPWVIFGDTFLLVY